VTRAPGFGVGEDEDEVGVGGEIEFAHAQASKSDDPELFFGRGCAPDVGHSDFVGAGDDVSARAEVRSSVSKMGCDSQMLAV